MSSFDAKTAADRRRALADILSPDEILTDPTDIEPFLTDHRNLYHGRAFAVVVPRTVEQVSQVARFCNADRIGLVPHGGNTGYCGGATPDDVEKAMAEQLAEKRSGTP